MSKTTSRPWATAVVLATAFTLLNVVELAVGRGGWPQIVGLPLGIALVVYGVARLRGWEGLQR